MKWIRYEEGFKTLHQTMGVSLIFFLFSLIYSQVILAACFASILAISIIQNIYYSNVGKDIKLLPNKSKSRFLIGSESNLLLEFENGKLPIWNGTLTISIQDSVVPSVDDMQHFSGIYDFSIPFSIGSRERVKITIPLKGRKRGLSRIARVIIDVPHIFGEGFIQMELDEPVKSDNLVYPKIVPFTGNLNPSPFKPGEVVQKHSLFHDELQPVGTRDYMPSDRFDQIHWTASARMQKLQTKQFLPVTAQSVMFILNAIGKARSIDDFEMKVERLASYVDYCTRHEVPYSIVINIHTFGAIPYMHLSTGTGKMQYQKALEMLAQLSEKNAKIPYENVLQSVDSKGMIPPTVLLLTHEPDRFALFTNKWSKRFSVLVDSSYEGEKNIGKGTN